MLLVNQSKGSDEGLSPASAGGLGAPYYKPIFPCRHRVPPTLHRRQVLDRHMELATHQPPIEITDDLIETFTFRRIVVLFARQGNSSCDYAIFSYFLPIVKTARGVCEETMDY